MDDPVKRASEFFNKGYSCSQAVLAGFGPRFGLDENLALRLGSGFGGGMNQGMPCGAVMGTYMILCLSQEDPNISRDQRLEVVDAKILELRKRFSEEFGSVICQDLLGMNVWTKEGRAKALEEGIFQKKCPAFVTLASQLLQGLLKA